MKRILIYLSILVIGLCSWSCSDDKPSGDSIFEDEDLTLLNDFDRWLHQVYRDPFNIKFLYKYVDTETDISYPLVPAGMKESQQLAALLKLLWLDPYIIIQSITDDEATGQVYDWDKGELFLKLYSPKIFFIIGCAAYNDGTITLGTAEGGMKITLYVGNWLKDYLYPVTPENITEMNTWFFKTMHHEFAHVLHQTINYPTEFNEISAGMYSPGSWHDRNDIEAHGLGFVSAYASSEGQEDFVETFAVYVTSRDEEWEEILDIAEGKKVGVGQAERDAKEIILEKLQYVRTYMQDKWGFNIDDFRLLVQSRYDTLYDLDMDTPLEWWDDNGNVIGADGQIVIEKPTNVM